MVPVGTFYCLLLPYEKQQFIDLYKFISTMINSIDFKIQQIIAF